MLRKLFGNKGLRNVSTDQCPYCKSRRVMKAGDMNENGIMPMQCSNCRARYDIIYIPAGYVIEGKQYRIDHNGHNTKGITLDIIWYEIRMQNQWEQLCPPKYGGCGDYYKALYTRAAHPEDALIDPGALCWTCAGVSNFFPMNTTEISIPLIWK